MPKAKKSKPSSPKNAAHKNADAKNASPKNSAHKKQPGSVGRPPIGSEDKRERIINEAVELFAQSGYWGTSLADIAQASEISKAGLLHHFGSKDQLFAEVLERRDEVTAGPWRDPRTNPWKLLDDYANLVEKNQTQPTMVKLYTSVTAMAVNADNPAHDWLRGHFDLAINTLAKRIEDAKAEGIVKPDAPSEMIARLLTAVSDGLQVQWLFESGNPESESEINMAEHFRMLIDLFKEKWAIEPE